MSSKELPVCGALQTMAIQRRAAAETRTTRIRESQNALAHSLVRERERSLPIEADVGVVAVYKMLLESEPTPLATKCFGCFDGESKTNVGHYKMHLRNHFVVKNGFR